jgi:hypothetical protein
VERCLRCVDVCGYQLTDDEAEEAGAGNRTLPHVWRGFTDDVA